MHFTPARTRRTMDRMESSQTEGFCPACYQAAIERLCHGFSFSVVPGNRPPRAVAVPPLGPAMATGVRAVAEDIVATRRDTARHGHSGTP